MIDCMDLSPDDEDDGGNEDVEDVVSAGRTVNNSRCSEVPSSSRSVHETAEDGEEAEMERDRCAAAHAGSRSDSKLPSSNGGKRRRAHDRDRAVVESVLRLLVARVSCPQIKREDGEPVQPRPRDAVKEIVTISSDEEDVDSLQKNNL